MRVLILGIGDAFTSWHFGSSALIDGPAGYVLLDCPDLIHRVVREATTIARWDVPLPAIDDIILTHLHGDHCNGLESLGFLRRHLAVTAGTESRPRLHTIPPVANRLWERLAPAMDGCFAGKCGLALSDFFELHLMEPDGDPAEIAGLSVRCRITRHPVPAIGLKISDGERTFGWSGDTAFDPAHIEWLSEADLIVHETNHGRVHTPIACLNALPDELRAKMRLIHVTDDFDQAKSDIRVLEEGEVLEV